MEPRAAVSNGIITIVIVFFMLMLGMVLKARYRLANATPGPPPTESTIVPKAIPVAIPVEPEVHQARAYKDGEWWVLPQPQLVISRANEADTLRIRSGVKEDVFILYFVDAIEANVTRPKRLRDQAELFQSLSQNHLMESGHQAVAWVTELLTKHPFVVYTKWGRHPDSERFYGFIRVELKPGETHDLGELLVRRGFASPSGQQTQTLPSSMPALPRYVKLLGEALAQAKLERSGAWALSLD